MLIVKRYDGSLVSKCILTVLCILQQIFAVDQNTPETQGTFWIRYGREDLKKENRNRLVTTTTNHQADYKHRMLSPCPGEVEGRMRQ